MSRGSRNKPLDEAERRLAESTAKLIATAQEVGLPDPPDKLGITPHAIQFLARAYLELLAKVEQLQIQDRVDQIASVAIEGALREVARQQGGIASEQIIDEAKSEGMLAAKPFIGDCVNTLANARRRTFPRSNDADNLRVVRAPAEVAKLSSAELIAIYCQVMRETEDVFVKYESYIVRIWDGMDGYWTDCTGAIGHEEALRYWAEKTGGGTHHVAYAQIDYYRIFPGDIRMHWDGSEGKAIRRSDEARHLRCSSRPKELFR